MRAEWNGTCLEMMHVMPADPPEDMIQNNCSEIKGANLQYFQCFQGLLSLLNFNCRLALRGDYCMQGQAQLAHPRRNLLPTRMLLEMISVLGGEDYSSPPKMRMTA
jgi:hypothetical protein